MEIFGEVLLSHAEILVFELFDPSFKGSILVSELYQLCVYLINSCNFRGNIQESPTSTEFPILCIALLHYRLYLSRYKLVVVLTVIL